jgi:hypothetical protein
MQDNSCHNDSYRLVGGKIKIDYTCGNILDEMAVNSKINEFAYSY